MPRIYRTRKEVELFLIREFFSNLGYKISRLKAQERPDALLTLRDERENKRIGVEHTEYFNDTDSGSCSPLTPLAEFWPEVQSSLVRRVSKLKHLTGIGVTVEFTKNPPIPPKSGGYPAVARPLAKQLIDFVEAHPVEESQFRTFRKTDLCSFPVLKPWLSWIRLHRWTTVPVPVSGCSWNCHNLNTANVGVKLNYIKSAIQKKNKKAPNYENWGTASEKWLLIAASGCNVSNTAGPTNVTVKWSDPDLASLCHASPFDRIVFWEMPWRWYKSLKPIEDVVQY